MIRKFFNVLIFIIAFPLSMVLYDKKIRNSDSFKGKYLGIFAEGWRWTVNDFIGRIAFRKNKNVRWPVSPFAIITNPNNIQFDITSLRVFQSSGTYFQAINAKIIIGKKCHIAPNVGLITTNHDFNNLELHLQGEDIIIGDYSWIGMNSVILPGVKLGCNTIVGAGSVVTKSFEGGNVIIAGNPAKIIKNNEKR